MPLLFFGPICLAAVFLWAAARPDTWESSRSRLRAGACIMLALAAFAGYAWYQQATARADLAKFIPPYPNATTTHWVPQVSDQQYWMLQTPDDPTAVADFYQQLAINSPWTLTRTGNPTLLHLILKKPPIQISITAQPAGTHTDLTYQLTITPE